MTDIRVLEAGPTGLRMQHAATGHVFTYGVDGGDLVPGRIEPGPGAKDPGDVAADVHAAAKMEARRIGLI